MINKILNLAKSKDVVFVDFFDTVMFRCVHSHQIMPQWEKALKGKYTELRNYNLCEIRKDAIKEKGNNECAISYDCLLREIYKNIKINDTFNSFAKTSYLIDFSLDMTTQYLNREMIETLRYLKKHGKKIYIVTDYYLPGKCYQAYLRPYDLLNFFDDIYCSSDFEKTKLDGSLYSELIKDINILPSKIIMIGDSKKADCENANKYGITYVHYFPLRHKILTNFRYKYGYSFSNHINKHIFKNSFKHSLFAEYSLNLYYFTVKLHECICSSDNHNKICFLARGGYFLRSCYDRYCYIKDREKVNTEYIKNSRKVNKRALENETDRTLLERYMKSFAEEDQIIIVDEGWYCTSQIIIENITNIKTTGYYIGIMGRKKGEEQYERRGILFDVNENNCKSPLYGVFRTNCTFYEQLLSAPHGSTVKYYEDVGEIKVDESWEEIEKDNYYNNIEPMQQTILDYITGLTAWKSKLGLYDLSKFVMKSLLFGSRDRIQKMKIVLDAWYDNANNTTEKNYTDLKKLHISIFDILIRPEDYLRYFCKIKELNNIIIRFIYPVLGSAIYFYCRISIYIKERLFRL